MGNCCHAEQDQDNYVINNMKGVQKAHSGYTAKGKDYLIDEILDERVIGGLAGEQKVEHIEKIQAHTRGRLARMRVANIKSSKELNAFA
jgi:hypothetical protein